MAKFEFKSTEDERRRVFEDILRYPDCIKARASLDGKRSALRVEAELDSPDPRVISDMCKQIADAATTRDWVISDTVRKWSRNLGMPCD